MNIEELIAAIAILILVAGVALFGGILFKRYIKNKNYSTPASQFTGETIFMMHAGHDGKKAMQEIVYQKDEEAEDEEGENLIPYLPEDKPE